jgi:hypothetical protein
MRKAGSTALATNQRHRRAGTGVVWTAATYHCVVDCRNIAKVGLQEVQKVGRCDVQCKTLVRGLVFGGENSALLKFCQDPLSRR